MHVKQFIRKSFPVEAVQVDADNMKEVAEWCDGTIRFEENKGHFIKVRVDNPLTERQTKAFETDWVLYAGKGYKVYTNTAFRRSFDEDNPPVAQNVFGGSASGTPDHTPIFGSGAAGLNPGGTSSV